MSCCHNTYSFLVSCLHGVCSRCIAIFCQALYFFNKTQKVVKNRVIIDSIANHLTELVKKKKYCFFLNGPSYTSEYMLVVRLLRFFLKKISQLFLIHAVKFHHWFLLFCLQESGNAERMNSGSDTHSQHNSPPGESERSASGHSNEEGGNNWSNV